MMVRRLELSPIMAILPLAAFVGVMLWPSGAASLPLARDGEQARFALCNGPVRSTCVVDGDTFWYRGEKIRVLDINAPEVSEPGCRREAELGARATRRLQALLNAGPFSLRKDPAGDDRDRYGRLLRKVTRGGESLGGRLVAEGLAREWQGPRRSWC